MTLDESADLWQTIPDSPVTTESNHTPIHNGLLFDGVRYWPGQQSLKICVLLRMTLHRPIPQS